MINRTPFIFLVGSSLFLAGCGGAVMAPVQGHVLCNGKPVKAATVTFSPTPKSAKDMEPGKSGVGFTEDDGLFVLSTHKELDGAQIGQHNVVVVLDETNPAPCQRIKKTQVEVKPGHNDFNIEMDPRTAP